MKKLIALLLTAAMMITAVYAADITVDRASGVVTVRGTAGAGARVMLLVLKQDKTVADIQNAAILDSVDYLDQTTATETGEYVFAFPSHSGADYSRLTVMINENNQLGEAQSFEVDYFTSATSDSMAASVIGLTDASLVKAMLTDEAIAILELDDTYYSMLDENDKTVVCGAVADITTGTKANVQTVFDNKAFLTYVNAMDSLDDVQQLYTALEADGEIEAVLGFDREFDLYAGLSNKDELKTRLMNGRPYANVAALKAYATESFALTAVHNYRYTFMENILNTYNNVLGLDLTRLTSKNEATCYQGIAGQYYSSKEELATAFNSYTAATGNKPVSGGSSGGGGGSSGGSFSGAGFGGMSAAAPAVTEQEAEKIAEENADKGFNDMADDHYALEAVKALVEKGIVSGYPDGSFQPDKDVIRTEMIKMLVTAFEIEAVEGETADFEDLDEDDWYYSYCVAAITNGILNGVSETSIGAAQAVTRQDVCVLLHRAITKLGYTLEAKEEVSFGDEADIADYAKESVMLFAGAGIVNGDGENFNPNDVASRGACAKIIYNVLAEVQK